MADPALTVADLQNARLDVLHIADLANVTDPAALEATDRLGQVKKTWAGKLVDVQNQFDATIQGVTDAKNAAAASATDAAANATAAAARAAEASAYAATGATGAKFYDTIAAGRAAVADTATFGVKAGGTDGLTRPTLYRRDTSTTQTKLFEVFPPAELSTDLRAMTDVVLADTLATLPTSGIPTGKYGIVTSDKLPVTSTTRSRSNGTALNSFNVSPGLAVGDSVNIRGFGGVGYNGHVPISAISGTTIQYKVVPPQANEAATADTGGTIDRNGVYQFDGVVWGWVTDIGNSYPVRPAAAAAARTSALTKTALNQAIFEAYFRPTFQPMQRVMTVNEAGTFTVDSHIPHSPDSAPMVYIDNVLLAYATKSSGGSSYTVPYTAPAAVDLDIDLKAVADSRVGTAKLAVAEAVRWTQDLTLWTKVAITSVTGGQADPDGGNNAYRVLCAASGTAAAHYIWATVSPANTAALTGLETWVKADTVSKVALWGATASNDIAYVDLLSGEIQTQKVNCAIVERRGPWVKLWVQQRLSAAVQTWRLTPITALGSVSNTTVGTEALIMYKPRQIDGVLPFFPRQRAAFRKGTVTYAERWIAQSDYMDAPASMDTNINVDVVVPDTYDATKRYPVLYVREVEATPGTSYADGLQTLKGMGVHNTYQCIMVRHYHPSADIPWDGVKNDGTMAHATFFEECVVPFIDSKYSTIRSREGRLLIGFSKSGWGAMSYLLRRPDLFGYAAVWDVPWGIQFDGTDQYKLDAFGNPSVNALGQSTAYGTVAQYQLYNPADILVSKVASVNDRARVVIGGASAWEGDMPYFKGLLDANGVQYAQHYIPSYSPSALAHNWNATWAGRMLQLMFGLR